MATSKLYGGVVPPTTGVTPPMTPLRKLSPEEMTKFVNWIPSGDSKAMSIDLGKRGLIGLTS